VEAGSSAAPGTRRELLPVDRIEACLRYYADYGEEIDEWIDRAHAIAEREEVRWHRRGEALA